MRTIIAGGRDYIFTTSDHRLLDSLHRVIRISIVLCGMQRGADMCGRAWAQNAGVRIEEYPWSTTELTLAIAYAKRNQAMADDADFLIAFPGQDGMADMIRRAEASRLRIYRTWQYAEDAIERRFL